MPGTDGAVAWEDFISFVADRLAPLLDRADKVGFCFSYPTEETPERDGRVLSLTKQVQLTGFEGRLICADLAAELERRGITGKSFVLLNDTPAVLLSGSAYAAEKSCDGLVGLISGTGTNTCCVLPDEAIKKPHGAFSGSMLVNLESGNFNGLPRGDFDAELDAGTCDPGVYRHEKMTSGAYLGELCRLTLRCAAREGLFSEAAAEKLLSLDALSAPEADAMACGGGDMFEGEDARTHRSFATPSLSAPRAASAATSRPYSCSPTAAPTRSIPPASARTAPSSAAAALSARRSTVSSTASLKRAWAGAL